MPPRKRPGSSGCSETKTKKAKQESPLSDHEDDIETILMLIQQQEESEALAKRMQEEWNNEDMSFVPGTSRNGHGNMATASGTPEVIVLDSDDGLSELPPDTRPSVSGGVKGLGSRLSVKLPIGSSQGKGKSKGVLSSNNLEARGGSAECCESQQNGFDVPPDQALSKYRDMFAGSHRCSQCSAVIPSPLGYVSFSPTIPPPSLLHILHCACQSCGRNHCRGCLTPIGCSSTCKGKNKNQDCQVLKCCANVRAIALFETLTAFDREYINERLNSDERAKASVASGRSAVPSVGPGGTGYSMGNYSSSGGPGGRGRGRGRGRKSSNPSNWITANITAHWEETIARFLLTVTELLPSPYDESAQTYDLIPHQSIRSLSLLSRLPDLLADLLRNDSVNDWITRVDVYSAMLGLLRRLADCELTVDILINHRWERTRTCCGLGDWMRQDGQIEWEMEGSRIAVAPPLFDYFIKLTKQCEAFLAGASQLIEGQSEGSDDGDTEETTVKAISLCGDIIAARDDIQRAMTILGKHSSSPPPASRAGPKAMDGKGKARDSAVNMEKEYSTVCEKLALRHVALGREVNGTLRYEHFNYAQLLQQTNTGTRNPKDRLHLVKELAVMATSLPPGIWVRVDEVRNDAIKVMIAGPEGTPYAGGLFEFDCFMPLQYPHTPPLVHLRTTAGGKVGFNPNLYSTGKVCLSLLGTWPGRPEEQWSSKSTLLQVLVSIQSMIMVDTPFFNEPGYGKANANDKRSIQYNRNVALQTVRWAMVEWMNDEYKSSIWADVIAHHFTIRHAKIRKCIEEWAKDDARMRNYDARSTQTAGTSERSYPGMHNVRASGGVDLLARYDQGIPKLRRWLSCRMVEIECIE